MPLVVFTPGFYYKRLRLWVIAIPAPYNSGYLEGSTPATYLNTTTATHDYSYPVSVTLATQSYFIYLFYLKWTIDSEY